MIKLDSIQSKAYTEITQNLLTIQDQSYLINLRSKNSEFYIDSIKQKNFATFVTNQFTCLIGGTPYFNRKRANYYVNNFAGGFTKDNKKSSTIVVHANGVSKKSINLGLFSISPKVKPGSTIKVVSEHKVKRRKKEDVDYNKHIESVITKITAIMSLYLLIERVNGQF